MECSRVHVYNIVFLNSSTYYYFFYFHFRNDYSALNDFPYHTYLPSPLPYNTHINSYITNSIEEICVYIFLFDWLR